MLTSSHTQAGEKPGRGNKKTETMSLIIGCLSTIQLKVAIQVLAVWLYLELCSTKEMECFSTWIA